MKKRVHFIGIGGIGMSALARWFLALNKGEGLSEGWAVSGSDLEASETTKGLSQSGIRVKIGHHTARNVPQEASLIVYSQAVRPDNPELRRARALGIETRSYPEAIGRLTEKYETICIAGAHGKSTVTALAALILTRAKLDPTVIIGTKLKEFAEENFKRGRSRYLILEADEYGRAFLRYSPALAVVTNIDTEHMEIFKTLANVKKSFLKFMSRTRPGGTLVMNRDDKNLFSLKLKVKKLAKARNLRVIWYSLSDPAAKKIRRAIKITGSHNVSNALAAFTLARALGVPESKILRAIGAYRGSWRRMEYRGKFKVQSSKFERTRSLLKPKTYNLKTRVYDDYAHHPTEIKATLKAFREAFPHRPIICVFQPHQQERLKRLFKGFQTAFNDADATLIIPFFKVHGRDHERGSTQIKTQINAETLVRAIQKRYPKKLVFYVANPKNLKKAIIALLRNGSQIRAEPTQINAEKHPRISAFYSRRSAIVVVMGAGDIFKHTDLLLGAKKK